MRPARPREIPPPRVIEAAADKEQSLPQRVRAYLEALPPGETTITYGALARALGLWMPGSVGKVTAALETTMREDAAAGRTFPCGARGQPRRTMLPGKGFFDLARALDRGPKEGEAGAGLSRARVKSRRKRHWPGRDQRASLCPASHA